MSVSWKVSLGILLSFAVINMVFFAKYFLWFLVAYIKVILCFVVVVLLFFNFLSQKILKTEEG